MPVPQQPRRASVIAQKKTRATRFIQATKAAGRVPWRMGSYVVLSLERIGDSVENVPNRVAGAAGTEEQKGQARVVP